MNLSDAEIGRIIERVQLAFGQTAGDGEAPAGGGEATVVLIPSFVPSPNKALACIAERYGENTLLVFLDSTEFESGEMPKMRLDWATQKNELIDRLVRAEHAVLLAPGTGLLSRMGGGADGDGFGEALLRRILWGKAVDVLLDFHPPKFKRGTYFAQLAEAIDTLSSMGMRFFTYQPVESGVSGACSLVTERDVIEAKQNGQKSILCAKEAIVTPLARDTAKELQINIEYI
jgi:hypothetical protein